MLDSIAIMPRSKKGPTAAELLDLARKHLDRVRTASQEPTDWSDLTIYGMYSVEAAILAAARHLHRSVKKTHWDKADFAAELAKTHTLPDVSEFVRNLNVGRKAAAYGDEEIPEEELGDPDVLVKRIAEFVEAVEGFISGPRK